MEPLIEKAAVEGDLQCPFRQKASSRRALVSLRKAPLVWSTVAMPSVSSLVSAIERTPQSAAAQALQA
jgi:hypothetical protein